MILPVGFKRLEPFFILWLYYICTTFSIFLNFPYSQFYMQLLVNQDNSRFPMSLTQAYSKNTKLFSNSSNFVWL